MVLSDITIRRLIDEQGLVVNYSPECIQPASIDCRLGDTFLIPVPRKDGTPNSFINRPEYEHHYGTYCLKPHKFVLGTTKEVVTLPKDLTAFVEGRSSVGRMGLQVENAGWVDPGFSGEITLELYNSSDVPILLTPGVRLVQLVFCSLDQPCETPYMGKYNGQRGATASKIHLDTERRSD